MTREDQLRKDTVDGLSTIAAKELRIQELLGKLDTATRLRLMHADDPRERSETDRPTRG